VFTTFVSLTKKATAKQWCNPEDQPAMLRGAHKHLLAE